MDESAEDFSSNQPPERRETAEALPSHALLNELLEGPRKRVQFFNTILSGQSEAGELSDRQITGELHSYEHHWLKENLKTINDTYQSLVLSSPETLPQRSELSFHIINQFIMPLWHRVLVSPKYPKMDAVDLETAQIRLAMESAKIISTRSSFEGPQDLFNNELRDFDTMIHLLQLSIDSELHSQPNVIVVPHPEIGSEHHQADFIIFEPTEEGPFQKREVYSSDIISSAVTPGTAAMDLLQKLRISSLLRRPEFQDKKIFHRLILSRETAKTFHPQQ